MKPHERPSSAGSHASVDSQGSSLSWLLSLEGERSQLGQTALVSLCDPETYDQKGKFEESSHENIDSLKEDRKTDIERTKITQTMNSPTQTAAERKEMKVKATEALLNKYKDSPYSRVPLPLDLRKELEKELLAKGQLPVGSTIDQNGNMTHELISTRQTKSDKETQPKTKTTYFSAENMLNEYKKGRESNCSGIGALLKSLSAEAKEKENSRIHHSRQPRRDSLQKWSIPKVETTQEAGKFQGEWKPFCGTEAISVPGQQKPRFKGKNKRASGRRDSQCEHFHSYSDIHYKPQTLSQKSGGTVIPSERDPLYRIMREEIRRCRKDRDNAKRPGPTMMTSRTLDTQSEYGVDESIAISISEDDIRAMRMTKLPSPKEWVVLRVVYFLVMTYFEQVIGSGSFSRETSDRLVNMEVTGEGIKWNKKTGQQNSDATERSGESLEIHQVHSTNDGFLGELYKHDELGNFWNTLQTIRRKHDICALNSVDTFSWEDMKVMLTHERAFLSVLRHIETGQEGKPALMLDDNGKEVHNGISNGANGIQEKYDSYHVFPKNWKSGQFYRSFREDHYEKLTLLGASTLLYPSYTRDSSHPTAYLCQWARRIIAGLFLAHLTVRRLSNKLPLAQVGIRPVDTESTNAQDIKEKNNAQGTSDFNNSSKDMMEVKEADSSQGPTHHHLIDNETQSLASGGPSQNGESVASTVLYEAIENVKTSLALSSGEAYHHKASLELAPKLTLHEMGRGLAKESSVWTTMRKIERFVTSSTLQEDFEGYYKQARASERGAEAENLIMALDAPRAYAQDKTLAFAILSPLLNQSNSSRDVVGYEDGQSMLLAEASSFNTGLAMSRPDDMVDVFVYRNARALAQSSQEKNQTENKCTHDTASYGVVDKSLSPESYPLNLYQSYHLAYTSKSPFHAIKHFRPGTGDGVNRGSSFSSTTSWLHDPSAGAHTISYSRARAALAHHMFGDVVAQHEEVIVPPLAGVTVQPGRNAESMEHLSASDLLAYFCDYRAGCVATVCKVANFTLPGDDDTLKFAKRIPHLNLVIVPTRAPIPLDNASIHQQRSNSISASKYVVCVSDSNSSSPVLLLNMVLRMAKPSDVIMLTHFTSHERLKLPNVRDSLIRLVNKFKARGFNVLVEYERSIPDASLACADSSILTREEHSKVGQEVSLGDREHEKLGDPNPFHVQARDIVNSALVHTPTYICIHCDASDVVHALCAADNSSPRGRERQPKSLPQAVLDYITGLPVRMSIPPTDAQSEVMPKLLMVASNLS